MSTTNSKTTKSATSAAKSPRARAAVAPPKPPSKPSRPEAATQETYLVQNPSPSILYVTDLEMTWEPYEVKDLVWEDPDKLSRSRDLANALKKTLLRRVTDEEYAVILDYEAERDRQEMFAKATLANRRSRRRNDDDDYTDTFDVTGSKANPDGNAVSTYGQANDPSTYAAAYDVYQAQCRAAGQIPNAMQFGEMVKANPGMLQNYLRHAHMSGGGLPGSVSGDPRRGRATVTVPPGSIRGGSTHAHVNMTNFHRDNVLAGAGLSGINTYSMDDDAPEYTGGGIDLDPGIGDEIDLDLD